MVSLETGSYPDSFFFYLPGTANVMLVEANKVKVFKHTFVSDWEWVVVIFFSTIPGYR